MNMEEKIEVLTARIERRNDQNKLSVKRYREKHREKCNAASLAYYNRKKEDLQWVANLRGRQREYQTVRRERIKNERLRTSGSSTD